LNDPPSLRFKFNYKTLEQLTNNILVSIIVPCYNQAIYLDETLQSVLAQVHTNWECIIVDDGSPDDTEKIATAWCDKDARFKYVKKTNSGVSSSRNVGIQKALGEYILPLDADDKISPDYIDGCLKEFEKNPATKIVYGKALLFGSENGEWPLPAFEYKKLLTRNLVYCTAMYRKADWEAIDGYDEKMVHGLEDWDFWLRLLSENDIVTRLNTITFYYRIKTRSRNADLYSNKDHQQYTYEYLYQKHFAKMNAIIGSPIQLYLDNEEQAKRIENIEQLLGNPVFYTLKNRAHKIKKRIRTLLYKSKEADKIAVPANNNTLQKTVMPASKFKAFKNKVKANIGSNKSIGGFVKSVFFYLGKKNLLDKVKKLIRSIARKIYVFIEDEHVIILNGEDRSLVYSKDPYKFWLSKNTISYRDHKAIKEDISIFARQPVFHILLYINSTDSFLHRTITSLNEQLYPYWKLCIITPSAATKNAAKLIVDEHPINEQNIDVLLTSEFIAKSYPNEDFILHLNQGDTLTPDALYRFAKASLININAEIIYSDEDLIGPDNNLHSPCFKPDWSPDNLLSVNYIQQSVVLKISLLSKIENWGKMLEEDNDYDLLLRAVEQTNGIDHLPELLFHAREPEKTKEQLDSKNEQSKKALAGALERRNEGGTIMDSDIAEGIFIPRFKLIKEAKVSIIIPTKDKTEILKVCIDSIVQRSTYKNYEIILIDNNSSTDEFFILVKKWEQEMPGVFKCFRTENPFNFAFLMNFGASHCTGDYYVLLNNDTEVITPNWIELLMEQAQRSSIGIAGAKLLYPDNTVQHAGVVIGLSALADHVFVGASRYSHTYQNYLHRVINYSALTAACFMLSKQKFEQVKGFNENFEVEYNDIDFCLRLKEAGYNHVYLPHVELYHHESISRGHPYATKQSYERHLREFDLMQKTWKKYIENDPCYNPNLSLKDRNMSVAY
jgi:glycosyltransferase involved in cell wall biosynthesis